MTDPILADVIRVEKNTRAEFTGEALKKGQDGWCLNTDVPSRGIEQFHRKLGSGDYVNLGVQIQTQIDTASTADRARANHTGTQLASTISDFDTAVASTSAVTANTAKVTNQTHTGDVTGATALTISNDAVTNAKMANMATQTIKGRNTASAGDPEDLSVATVKTMLSLPTNTVTDLSGKSNLSGGNQFSGIQSISATGSPEAGTSILSMMALGDSAYRTMFQTDGSLIFGTGVSGQWDQKAVLSRKSAGVLQVGTDAIVVEPVLHDRDLQLSSCYKSGFALSQDATNITIEAGVYVGKATETTPLAEYSLPQFVFLKSDVGNTMIVFATPTGVIRTSAVNLVGDHSYIPLYTVTKQEDGVFSFVDWRMLHVDARHNAIIQRLYTRAISKAEGSGLLAVDPTTKAFTITAATVFNLDLAVSLSAYTSTVDQFKYAYNTTVVAGRTVFDWTKYNNNGTLATVTTGKFGNHWVFRECNTDGKIYVVYGSSAFNSEAEAANEKIPTVRPTVLGDFTTYEQMYRVTIQGNGTVVRIDDLLSVYGGGGSSSQAVTSLPASAVTVVPTGGIASVDVQSALAELDLEKQPIDATLTALAGYTGGAGTFPVFAGVDVTPDAKTITATALTLLDDATTSDMRTTLGLPTEYVSKTSTSLQTMVAGLETAELRTTRMIRKSGHLNVHVSGDPIARITGFVQTNSGQHIVITVSYRGTLYSRSVFGMNATSGLQRFSCEGNGYTVTAKTESGTAVMEFYSTGTLTSDTIVSIEWMICEGIVSTETIVIKPGATTIITPIDSIVATNSTYTIGKAELLATSTCNATQAQIWAGAKNIVNVETLAMTTAGDLIVGGVSGIPTRLARPTANDQALVLNTAGNNIEWKTTFILDYKFSRGGWKIENFPGGDADLPYLDWEEDLGIAPHTGRGARATASGRVTAVTFQFDPSYMSSNVTAYIKKNGVKTDLGTVTTTTKYATFSPTNYTFALNDEILCGFTGTNGKSYGYPTATVIIRNLI